ncbi:hypothetical protein FPV67DRAFT_1669393 [Lyophyllum atratum]|nr:hypothetical protein FPV67DRAFT_1669393 [Lyophyllum atratum]
MTAASNALQRPNRRMKKIHWLGCKTSYLVGFPFKEDSDKLRRGIELAAQHEERKRSIPAGFSGHTSLLLIAPTASHFQLKQDMAGNAEIVVFIRVQYLPADAAYASNSLDFAISLTNPGLTNPAESAAQGQAHKSIANELDALVPDPFEDWARDYGASWAALSILRLSYEQSRGNAAKLKTQYSATLTCHIPKHQICAKQLRQRPRQIYHVAESSSRSSSRRTPPARTASVSERISQRLKEIQKRNAGALHSDLADDDETKEKALQKVDKGKGKADRAFLHAPLRHRLRRLLALTVGWSELGYYAPQIFNSIGCTGTENFLLASGICGIVMVVATAIFVFSMVESLGRRLSLIISSIGMGTLFFCIGAILKTHPQVARADPPPPSKAMAALLCIYVCFYSMGWGPLPWVYASGVFPPRMGVPMTKKRFAELGLCLLHLQQNVEIPETHPRLAATFLRSSLIAITKPADHAGRPGFLPGLLADLGAAVLGVEHPEVLRGGVPTASSADKCANLARNSGMNRWIEARKAKVLERDEEVLAEAKVEGRDWRSEGVGVPTSNAKLQAWPCRTLVHAQKVAALLPQVLRPPASGLLTDIAVGVFPPGQAMAIDAIYPGEPMNIDMSAA